MKTAKFSARVDVDSDDGGFKPMKRTIVTCIIRIVFAFWLVVSIALVLATVGLSYLQATALGCRN
jgi:hypothetical protein